MKFCRFILAGALLAFAYAAHGSSSVSGAPAIRGFSITGGTNSGADVTGTVTVPSGAMSVTIRIWARGGQDGSSGGAGGGGGAACKITLPLLSSDAGKVFTYHSDSTSTRVTSSGMSFANINMVANKGQDAFNVNTVGAGGTGSGGDVCVSGGSGVTTTGGASGTIDSLQGGTATTGQNGKFPGGGTGSTGNVGGAAELHFTFTQ